MGRAASGLTSSFAWWVRFVDRHCSILSTVPDRVRDDPDDRGLSLAADTSRKPLTAVWLAVLLVASQSLGNQRAVWRGAVAGRTASPGYPGGYPLTVWIGQCLVSRKVRTGPQNRRQGMVEVAPSCAEWPRSALLRPGHRRATAACRAAPATFPTNPPAATSRAAAVTAAGLKFPRSLLFVLRLPCRSSSSRPRPAPTTASKATTSRGLRY